MANGQILHRSCKPLVASLNGAKEEFLYLVLLRPELATTLRAVRISLIQTLHRTVSFFIQGEERSSTTVQCERQVELVEGALVVQELIA